MIGHKAILKMGNPLLREVSKPLLKKEILSNETKKLIKKMWNIMAEAGGIGLAAPQIGVLKQVAVIKLDSESKRYEIQEDSDEFVIINPSLEILDKTKQGFWEGCLSVPGLRGFVERPRKLRITYLDEEAIQNEIIVEDFLATVFQHELDHLFGYLYVDRLNSVKDLIFEDDANDISEEKLLD